MYISSFPATHNSWEVIVELEFGAVSHTIRVMSRNNTLYVTGWHRDVNHTEVRNIFKPFPTIARVFIKMYRKGPGVFIQFDSPYSAFKAMQKGEEWARKTHYLDLNIRWKRIEKKSHRYTMAQPVWRPNKKQSVPWDAVSVVPPVIPSSPIPHNPYKVVAGYGVRSLYPIFPCICEDCRKQKWGFL